MSRLTTRRSRGRGSSCGRESPRSRRRGAAGDRSGWPSKTTPNRSCASRSNQFAPRQTDTMEGTVGSSGEDVRLHDELVPLVQREQVVVDFKPLHIVHDRQAAQVAAVYVGVLAGDAADRGNILRLRGEGYFVHGGGYLHIEVGEHLREQLGQRLAARIERDWSGGYNMLAAWTIGWGCHLESPASAGSWANRDGQDQGDAIQR